MTQIMLYLFGVLAFSSFYIIVAHQVNCPFCGLTTEQINLLTFYKINPLRLIYIDSGKFFTLICGNHVNI